MMRTFGTLFRIKGSRVLWMHYWHNGQRFRESTKRVTPKAAKEALRHKMRELQVQSAA